MLWIRIFYMALNDKFLNGLVESPCETFEPGAFCLEVAQ